MCTPRSPAVNGELERIERSIEKAARLLAPGGRLGIISFHSLEDRIVKQTFKRLAKKCTCPPEQMQCTCSGQALIKILNKKPVIPTDEEIAVNAPSRSAKFRFAERLSVDE